MIKNNAQLERTKQRLNQIQNQAEELRKAHLEADLELRILPILDEIEELSWEIAEYRLLRELPLEEIVEGPLSAPVLLDNIGQLLAKMRVGAGLTQSQVAELLDWKQSNVARFESENYTSHTVSKVLDYASALGVYLHVVPSMTEFVDQASYMSLQFQKAAIPAHLAVEGWITSRDEGWEVKQPLLGIPYESSSNAPIVIELLDWAGEQKSRVYFYEREPEDGHGDTARSVEGSVNVDELTAA